MDTIKTLLFERTKYIYVLGEHKEDASKWLEPWNINEFVFLIPVEFGDGVYDLPKITHPSK